VQRHRNGESISTILQTEIATMEREEQLLWSRCSGSAQGDLG